MAAFSSTSRFLARDDVVAVGATATGGQTTHRPRGFSPLHTQSIQILSPSVWREPLGGGLLAAKAPPFLFSKKVKSSLFLKSAFAR